MQLVTGVILALALVGLYLGRMELLKIAVRLSDSEASVKSLTDRVAICELRRAPAPALVPVTGNAEVLEKISRPKTWAEVQTRAERGVE